MNSEILAWRPRLRDSLVVERCDDELLFISTSDRRVKRFAASELVVRVMPLLTGRHSVADLVDLVCAGSADAVVELCTALLTMCDEHLLSRTDTAVATSTTLPAEQVEHYDRQIRLFQELCDADLVGTGTGVQVQERLAGSTVLVCGVGGLGCVVAASLAAAGVGHLVLCDGDVVERANLVRQYLYSVDDVGVSKVDALARRLRGINPYVSVTTVHRTIGAPVDIADLVSRSDLVISCADQPTVTDMAKIITAACWPHTPHILGGAYSYHVGILGLTVIPNVTACWYCLLENIKYEHGRDRSTMLVPRSSKVGVLGTQSGIVAHVLAWEAIRLVTGMPTALDNRWAELDYWPLAVNTRALTRHPDCPRCSPTTSTPDGVDGHEPLRASTPA